MPRVSSNPPAATIWTSRPSRIHAVPNPKTTIQWKRDHGMSCIRAGIMLLIGLSSALSAVVELDIAPSLNESRRAHIPRFRRSSD
jgi:hypothetical protein